MNPRFAQLGADLARSREEQTAALRRKIGEAKARARLDQVVTELRLAAELAGDAQTTEVPVARLVALAEVVESEAKMLVARALSAEEACAEADEAFAARHRDLNRLAVETAIWISTIDNSTTGDEDNGTVRALLAKIGIDTDDIATLEEQAAALAEAEEALRWAAVCLARNSFTTGPLAMKRRPTSA